MSAWIFEIYFILLVTLVSGMGLIRYGYTIPPRDTCLTLAQQPKKEYQCTPGSPGANRAGPQGIPGRDCYPTQDNKGSFTCTYTPPNFVASRYARQRVSWFEVSIYVLWSAAVVFTVYTLKQQLVLGGVALVGAGVGAIAYHTLLSSP